MGVKQSVFQPDHSGKCAAVNTYSGMHGPGQARGSEAIVGESIARDGKSKLHRDVPIHGGMTDQQRALKGMGHAIGSAPDASAANPLDIEPRNPDKQRSVSITPGMRSRTSHVSDETHAARGRAVLDDALSVAGSDHPENIARRLRGG